MVPHDAPDPAPEQQPHENRHGIHLRGTAHQRRRQQPSFEAGDRQRGRADVAGPDEIVELHEGDDAERGSDDRDGPRYGIELKMPASRPQTTNCWTPNHQSTSDVATATTALVMHLHAQESADLLVDLVHDLDRDLFPVSVGPAIFTSFRLKRSPVTRRKNTRNSTIANCPRKASTPTPAGPQIFGGRERRLDDLHPRSLPSPLVVDRTPAPRLARLPLPPPAPSRRRPRGCLPRVHTLREPTRGAGHVLDDGHRFVGQRIDREAESAAQQRDDENRSRETVAARACAST